MVAWRNAGLVISGIAKAGVTTGLFHFSPSFWAR
jgi:hypothetical protein